MLLFDIVVSVEFVRVHGQYAAVHAGVQAFAGNAGRGRAQCHEQRQEVLRGGVVHGRVGCFGLKIQ